MRAAWLLGCGLVACGGRTSASTPEPPPANVFLPPDPVAADPGSVPAEPMGFAAFEGILGVGVTVGGRTTRHTVGVEQASLRFGDVRTLQYPIGHIKVDPTTWQSLDEPSWSASIVDLWFKDVHGAPVQVFFDFGSFTEVTEGLTPGGPPRDTVVLGSVQIDSRKQDFDARVRVSRPEAERLHLQIIGEAPLDLSGFARDAASAALGKALGGAIGGRVTLSGELDLPRWRELAMPSFVRTAVTMATVQEVREAVKDEVDRFEMSREGAEAAGMDEHILDMADRDAFNRMERQLRAKQAERASRR